MIDLAAQQRRRDAARLRPLIGGKIRGRRQALGITQSALAARLGVSAAYLNLIESNKRRIGGALLRRIGDELGLAVDELEGVAERKLIDDLCAVAAEPLLAPITLDVASANELAGRHAGWARALVALHRAWRDRDQTVHALAERLTQDPFLSDAVHSLLTRVAAIRSSADILATVDDLAPAQRRRFLAIIGGESERLASVTEALAAFFDKGGSEKRPLMPVEEVDDFLFDRNNHFPEVEGAASQLRDAVGLGRNADDRALLDYVSLTHGVEVREHPAGDEGGPVIFDRAARTLSLSDALPPATRRFELARAAGELSGAFASFESDLAASPLLTTPAARRRAQRVLSAYLASAALLPYDPLLAAAIETRYDVDRLARRFGASFEQVCHRLVTLRRPGAEAIPFGLMRVDAAGYVTKRFPLPRLPLPRYGNGCPIWVLYTALQAPGTLHRQVAEFPTGDRFLFVARAVEKPRPAFAMPPRLMSVMLACDAVDADRTVYAEGLDLTSVAGGTPVGSNCRVCVRRGCAYREEDAIIDA